MQVLLECQLLQPGLGKQNLYQKPERKSTARKDSLLLANLRWSWFSCFTTFFYNQGFFF